MADYPTRFSFMVPSIPDAEDLIAYIEAEADKINELGPDDDTHPIFGDDPAGMPVISVHDDGIWFRDDAGESSIDTTANVVCWLLEQPKGPVEPVVFEWVSLSSKPEIDSFHGGAVRCVPGRWTCKHTSDLIDLLNKEAEA